jgi:glycosyltransferase involved in cell wall biosynthesis
LAELIGFRSRGNQVWLLAPRESEIFKRATTQQISVKLLCANKQSFAFEIVRQASWLRRNQIQVVNTHSSRDGWLIGIAGRLARVPFIVRTRHIDVDYPNRWLSRHAYTTLADHVLTTSRKITAHFQEMFGLPDDRISTVPTGIDLEIFSPSGAKAAFSAGGKPLIGMISVLRSWKGHATFLQAARRLLDEQFNAQFVIVGEGPIRQSIEKQIAELRLGNAVILSGHREDVPEILRALQVLAIPSTKHEGIPQIGLQALACQAPVVGSDAGGIPEIIRHGETGRIFPAGDAGALASAIRETIAETERTRDYCEQGRSLVEAGFSLKSMLESLDSLYQRSLVRKRNNSGQIPLSD